jgi:hypothetical protein
MQHPEKRFFVDSDMDALPTPSKELASPPDSSERVRGKTELTAADVGRVIKPAEGEDWFEAGIRHLEDAKDELAVTSVRHTDEWEASKEALSNDLKALEEESAKKEAKLVRQIWGIPEPGEKAIVPPKPLEPGEVPGYTGVIIPGPSEDADVKRFKKNLEEDERRRGRQAA